MENNEEKLLYQKLREQIKEEQEIKNCYKRQKDILEEDNKILKHQLFMYEMIIKKLCESSGEE